MLNDLGGQRPFAVAAVLSVAAAVGCGSPSVGPTPTSNAAIADQVLRLEKAALDRWGNGDPEGYVALLADDATYFDPGLDARMDSGDALARYLRPFAGKIRIDRYEMSNAAVHVAGDAAILTYNLVNYRRGADGAESVMNRWNCTQVYQRIGTEWKIVHNHWSYTKPELANQAGAG